MPSLQKWNLLHLCLGRHRPEGSALIINGANKQTTMMNKKKVAFVAFTHTNDIPYLYTDAPKYEEDLQLLDV